MRNGALMGGQPVLAQKRPLSVPEDDLHPSKKRRQSYQRHHSLHCQPQSVPATEPVMLEQQALDKLLVTAIKDICEDQGMRGGVQDLIIESLALEAFRNATEEFILKFCAMARRSMLSARRIVPIPTDFEFVIRYLDLPWPDDQLKPFTLRPTINPSLLPTPPPEDAFHRQFQLPTSLLGPGLDGRADRRKDRHIPSHLPPFPSQHTYKDTPLFPIREVDPRRIRELATEEGKLGEEALRKLAGAAKAENTISAVQQTEEDGRLRTQEAHYVPERTMESVFEATVRDLLKGASSGGERFELGPLVNCEKRFLMKEAAPVARRRPPDHHQHSVTPASASHSVVLSEKAKGKQRPNNADLDEDRL